MKAILLSVVAIVLSTALNAKAMNRLGAKDLAAAHDEVIQELQTLNKDFHVAIRHRVAAETESILLTAEVETLPGAEVAKPWVLTSPQATLNSVDGEEVSAFETAQLAPGDRHRD